ncbi:pheromone processing endoprotease [Yamadazyma tenuis]|uniref:P/Homo B domain-containing protein n=1 Tax=Candida tenuis (strain ATCC 10573 / BCRC 21748 / CBS 615 / JCM 9827 / NBRC 10315 / NRRL Y-1498 / VKM Y-70) TaxID=590646 RepID=G3B8L5_CANTC|nr:uncharacterized protein CANTEDRAFT_124869 [Yamadazyma tenuis ATCC 10573]EGV61765.1 hypothetical protein CANTEDRAFT_124869 [Yamadazyma tenuis ATCC 10573]WEJ92992.1 pheromone processing endoprotease [Yamadazyma tenuis]
MIFRVDLLLVVLHALMSTTGAWASEIPARDYANKNYFMVELDTASSSDPLTAFINQHKDVYQFEHQARGFDDHFVFSIPKGHEHNQFLGNYNSNNHHLMQKRQDFEQEYEMLVTNQNLKSIHMLVPRVLERRAPVPVEPEEYNMARGIIPIDSSQLPIKDAGEKLGINDPIFAQQWHLINTQFPGNDVNVTGLWYEGITGEGVVTSVIDDGLDYEDADLRKNFNKEGSWDFNDNTNLPKPRLFNDYHGTRCAGEIAAVKNNVCGVGVAYDSQVSGIRILSGPLTPEDEAAAMIFGLDINDIYSCSWGPTDDGRTLSAPEKIVKKAMLKGVQEGRENKGSIYVFASGNGGRSDDSCNFDGYTNSIYSITVGAIDYKGLHPLYAEACSAVMVVTYSSGSGEHIHTTDIHGKCSAQHGGTSAAAPLAAGIFSLVLQVNPDLTWRDLQYVAALSSVPVNEKDGHYQTTALGRQYSHKYGYGKVDAYRMAHFGKTWENVKPQSWYYSDVIPVDKTIKIDSSGNGDKDKIISSTLKIGKQELDVMNLERVEHVTVTVNIQSTFRGQVGARLKSPFGVTSDLASFRPHDISSQGFVDWTFSSVAHWGESGVGDWTLEVFNAPDSKGNDIKFVNWQLRLFGESQAAEQAETYDIDKDYAQVRRDRLEKSVAAPVEPSSSSSSSSTSTTELQTFTTSTKAEESVASDDESKEQEGKLPDLVSTTSAAASTTSSATSAPDDTENDSGDGKNAYGNGHSGLYFMALMAIGFIIIAAIMWFHKTPGSSRRRRRREEYEFDIIPGEDYSDSEDVDSHDSFDLGHHNDDNFSLNEERDRLYDDLNGETLPDYHEDEEMFKIGDEEEDAKKPLGKKVNFQDDVTSGSVSAPSPGH